jgi:hypothetical protein
MQSEGAALLHHLFCGHARWCAAACSIGPYGRAGLGLAGRGTLLTPQSACTHALITPVGKPWGAGLWQYRCVAHPYVRKVGLTGAGGTEGPLLFGAEWWPAALEPTVWPSPRCCQARTPPSPPIPPLCALNPSTTTHHPPPRSCALPGPGAGRAAGVSVRGHHLERGDHHYGPQA